MRLPVRKALEDTTELPVLNEEPNKWSDCDNGAFSDVLRNSFPVIIVNGINRTNTLVSCCLCKTNFTWKHCVFMTDKTHLF